MYAILFHPVNQTDPQLQIQWISKAKQNSNRYSSNHSLSIYSADWQVGEEYLLRCQFLTEYICADS